jgi:membrane protease YdiL (CAAX protease family)
MKEDAWGPWLWHLLVAVLWIAGFRLLADHGVSLLPVSLARQLSLMSYLVGVGLVTASLGLLLAFVLLREPREALGLCPARPLRLCAFLLLSPAIYLAASYLAISVALPTLLAELQSAGREAVQRQSGEFGREVGQSGLGLALIFGVGVSPLGEELMFRGALWSLVQRGMDALTARGAAAPRSDALPSGVLEESLGLRSVRALGAFFATGGVATLVAAGVFAWMHADMPGGLGIVRWVSALGLGLAAGIARHATGSLLGALAVHASFNFWSLAATRRWLVTETFGTYRSVPTLLALIAGIAVVVWAGAGIGLRLAKRQ